MYVVYALEDPRDNKVWYVGMTDNLQDRFIQHLRCNENNLKKNEWVHNLASHGYLPIIRTLEISYGLVIARKREQYWISHYEHLHMPLTNQTLRDKQIARPALPPHKMDSVDVTDKDTRILRLLQKGATMSQVILEIYGVRSGAAYTQRTREIMELIGRYLPAEKVGEL